MTDRTHPDSGIPFTYGNYVNYAEHMQALRDRIAELEAQLEAIGAGGVSGPLMGQPQEMPDLTTLTERGAKAWAGVDAQGLRDGVASAGSEPVAWVDSWTNDQWIDLAQRHANADWDSDNPDGYLNAVKALCNDFAAANPSPPEGMVGWWRPMADAPRDGTLILAAIYIYSSDGTEEWQRHAIYFDDERDCTYLDGGDDTGWEFDDYEFWTPLPPPPTTSAGSGKGE